MFLRFRFFYTRDPAGRGQFTETDTAELELANVSTGTAAVLAAGIFPDFELVGPFALDNKHSHLLRKE